MGISDRVCPESLERGLHEARMARPLKKATRLVERKPERAKVTREEFLKNIKTADEWRKKRLAKIKESSLEHSGT